MQVLAVAVSGLAAQRLSVGVTPLSLLMAAVAGAGALASMPAIAVAALFSDGPLALDGPVAAQLIMIELAGAVTALGIVKAIYPKHKESALRKLNDVAANGVVIPLG